MARPGLPPSTALARLAARRSLSAQQVADEVGVSLAAVYSWFAGRRRPGGPAMRALAKLLGRSVPAVDKLLKE